MAGKDDREKKKQSGWSVLHFLPHMIGGAAGLKYGGMAFGLVVAIALAVVIATLVVGAVRRRTAARKIERAKEATGRWPLREPYRIDVIEKRGATPKRCELVFGDDALAFSKGSSTRVGLADVTHVHVGGRWVDLDVGERRVRVQPRSESDRERLLWELAVRCNDAMERGLDVAAGEDASATATASPGMDDLDRRMSGLASDLAGPATSGNPAPPRKSGLGVGLFVPTPGRREEK